LLYTGRGKHQAPTSKHQLDDKHQAQIVRCPESLETLGSQFKSDLTAFCHERRSLALVGWSSTGAWRLVLGASFPLLQQRTQRLHRIRLNGFLVPAPAVDAGEAHGQSGLVALRRLDAFEGQFEDELGPDFSDRFRGLQGVVPDGSVDFFDLGISKARMGLAMGRSSPDLFQRPKV
jgi:hypothetical protein